MPSLSGRSPVPTLGRTLPSTSLASVIVLVLPQKCIRKYALCSHHSVLAINDHSQLFCVTADNTPNNDTTCEHLARLIRQRKLPEWDPKTQRLLYMKTNCSHATANNISHFSCLEHVVNLGVVSVMSQITKIGAIKNATAIWEYDPTLPSNSVLGGSLDVIAAIRTLAIKVYSSARDSILIYSQHHFS